MSTPPVPMVQNLLERNIAPVVVVVALASAEMLGLAIHSKRGLDFGIGLGNEPPVVALVCGAFPENPVRGARAPHGELRLHRGVIHNAMVFIMHPIRAVFVANKVLVDLHIAYALRRVNRRAFFAMGPHIGTLARRIDNLEVGRGPCGARCIEIVLREEDHHNGRSVLERDIGVPPFECALAAIGAHAVFLVAWLFGDAVALVVGLLVGKSRNKLFCHDIPFIEPPCAILRSKQRLHLSGL